MCFDCQPVFPPSPKAERLNRSMYIILICEVVLAILRFALAWDFFGGLIECFMCLILYCGIKQMQYCSMLMYIIVCLLFWVFAFVSIGTVIQHSLWDELQQSSKLRLFIVNCIAFIFYFAAMTVGFYCYREYKALQYEYIGSGLVNMFQRQGGGGGGGGAQGQEQHRQQDYAPQGQYQPPPYHPQPQQPPPSVSGAQSRNIPTTQQNRGFVPFSGTGVRIG